VIAGDRLQCFMPIGALPIEDVMLAQKVALETCKREVREVHFDVVIE